MEQPLGDCGISTLFINCLFHSPSFPSAFASSPSTQNRVHCQDPANKSLPHTNHAGWGDFSPPIPLAWLCLMELDSSDVLPLPCGMQMWSFTCFWRHRGAGFRWQKQAARRASPKCTKRERQMGQAGTARGQLEEKALPLPRHPREPLCTYLGKSCRRVPPLYAFFPGRLQPRGGVWSVDFFLFSRASSVGLHFYAFLSEFSQGNSSWWAQKCQSESWPSLGPWRFLQKVKKVSGPVSPLGFPSPASHLFHLLFYLFIYFSFLPQQLTT